MSVVLLRFTRKRECRGAPRTASTGSDEPGVPADSLAISDSGGDLRDPQRWASHSLAEGRLRSCDSQSVCVDAARQAHALVRCDKPGRELERELIKAGAAVGKAVPKNASLIVIPATNDGGWITQFGEYASRILHDSIDANLPAGALLRSIPKWDPTALHEVARRYKATHAIEAQHVSAGGTRMLFSVWLVDLATEQPVPHSEASFQFDLEPEQQDMITVLGPLFPNKDAWALAANHGESLQVRVRNPRELIAISAARAQAVYSALAERRVETKRLMVSGLGGEDPVFDNSSTIGRSGNNRIEIVFLYH